MATLIPLQRGADAAADMYDTYARTLRQTDASMLIPATTVRVAARSEVPISPAFPNNMIMLPASTLMGWFWLMKPGGASIETWCWPGEMPRIRDGSLSVRDSPSSRQVVTPPGTTYRSKPVF